MRAFLYPSRAEETAGIDIPEEGSMRWLAVLSLVLMAPLIPARAADAPKGKIVYSRKDGEKFLVHVMNADGTDDKALPGQTDDANIFPSWSPDGKRIAYMAGPMLMGEDFHIVIVNADGTSPVTPVIPGKFAGLPVWSPDGKHLAVTAGDQLPTIFLCDGDGGNPVKFSPENAGGVCAFWMADSKRLGYTRLEKEMAGPKGEIVIQKLEGGDPEVITSAGKLAVAGANGISPDGKRLAFALIEGENTMPQLSIRDLESKSDSFISDLKLPELKGPSGLPMPAWSPDGKSFIVVLNTDKGAGLFRVSDDGQTKTRLTPEGVECVGGAWSAQ